MTKSQKIEGAFSTPSQASTTVSAAKPNIKTPKSEMFDTKSDIKIPKTEAVGKPVFPENNKTMAALSGRESDIKPPKSEMLGNDSLTPLKRKFGESSCHLVEEEHGATDEENTSTDDEEEEHDRTDNSEDHSSSDEDEDEDHGSTDEDEDDSSTDEDEDEELATSMMLLMMAFVLTTGMHVFSFRP